MNGNSGNVILTFFYVIGSLGANNVKEQASVGGEGGNVMFIHIDTLKSIQYFNCRSINTRNIIT